MAQSEPFRSLAASIQDRFRSQRRLLSFWEFLEEVRLNPYLRLRSAAQYVRDIENGSYPGPQHTYGMRKPAGCAG